MLTAFVATTLLSIPVALPVPQKKEPKGKAEAASSHSHLKTWTDKEAKEKLKTFKAMMKGKKVKLKQKMDALATLEEGRNALLVKPLASVVKRDKRLSVRRRAAELLGNQPKKSARKALINLMKDKKVRDEPSLEAALIRSYAKESYHPSDWKDFQKQFLKYQSDPRKERAVVEKAIVVLAGKAKEKESVRMLLNAIDAPQPVNVDDPSNPPAAYWERRWKNWEVWRADVKESLFQITGQRFSSRREARKWLRKNAKKLGIKKY